MKRTVILSVVVAVAILALLIGNLVRGTSSNQEDSAALTQAVEELVVRPDCPAPTVAGVALPCLGESAVLSQQVPEWTVVNLWAWWCGPCQEELPFFVALRENHPDLAVVGVHADTSAAKGAAFLEDMGLALPSYQDDNNLFAGTLGLPGVIPQTLVLRGGEVVATFVQPFATYEELEAAVQEVRA